MMRASGEHKKRITSAISSGLGQLAKSAAGMAGRFAGVSKMLGTTELTQIGYDLTSAASESNSASAPAFDAAYRAAPGDWPYPAREATLTIQPRLCRIMTGITARASTNPAFRLSDIICS